MDFLIDPWSWWIEPFSDNAFMRRELLAGLLVVVSTSVVGVWVVLRGMSFLGDALAHGVLPGIAVAFAIGTSTTIGAFIAALAMVGGVNLIRSYSPLPEDTSIGVLFVGFLALAVVIVSANSGTDVEDLDRFLFGAISLVDNRDLVRQAIAAAVSLFGVVAFHRAFMVLTFNETQARLLGLRPRLTHAVLLGLVVISIVSSFEAVGSLLVFAFLVAPPAAASLLVRRVPFIMVTAVALGAVAVVVGLLVSFHHGTAEEATMALVSVVGFLVILAGNAIVLAISDRVRQRAVSV